MDIAELRDTIESANGSEYWTELNAMGQLIDSTDGEVSSKRIEFPNLIYDLQNFGLALLSLAMNLMESKELKEFKPEEDMMLARSAFENAGKALGLVTKNNNSENFNFYCILSAGSTKLGNADNENVQKILKKINDINKLNRIEKILYQLINTNNSQKLHEMLNLEVKKWRKYGRGKARDQSLCNQILEWSLSEEIKQRPEERESQKYFNKLEQLLDLALTDKYFSGIEFCLTAIEKQEKIFYDLSKKEIYKFKESSCKLNLVYQWWYSSVTFHLIDELSVK